MPDLDLFAAWILTSVARVRGRESDRGDVPGWVMVTIMTAGLVVIVFAAFKSAITGAISEAVKNVIGSSS